MIPTISKPTRVTRHTAAAIDHVLSHTIMDNIEIKTAVVKQIFPTIFLSSLLQKTK